MSDRVTNSEIEDVLSSIRRLVSIDDRRGDASPALQSLRSSAPSTASSPQNSRPVETPRSKVRLVLSQDFRVEQPDDVPGPAQENSETVNAGPEETTAENVQISSSASEVSGPAYQETVAQTASSEDTETVERDQTSAALGLEKWQVEPAPSEDGQEPRSLSDGKTEKVGLEGQDLEERLARARKQRALVLSGMNADQAAEAASSKSVTRPQTKTLEGAAPGTKELEARIAEVEAAVAARDDQWEPDGSEPDAGMPPPITSLSWRQPDQAAETAPVPSEPRPVTQEASATPEAATPQPVNPSAPPKKEAKAGAEDHWYGEDAVIDEAALRDLVSEIVRQELQGSLGERITRNVRKLVRREIHRAMMGHDLD
ncbi:MAG: hypothetical protein AAFO72_11005 [Pseudomonadota bacterium]